MNVQAELADVQRRLRALTEKMFEASADPGLRPKG